MTTKQANSGFTLMELLIVIGLITILVSITLVAINPNKQLKDARNAFRMSSNVQIENAVWQYVIDNHRLSGVPASKSLAKDICRESVTGVACTDSPLNGFELNVLTPDYIISLPIDTKAANPQITGFRIYANGTIIKVCSVLLESDCGE